MPAPAQPTILERPREEDEGEASQRKQAQRAQAQPQRQAMMLTMQRSLSFMPDPDEQVSDDPHQAYGDNTNKSDAAEPKDQDQDHEK